MAVRILLPLLAINVICITNDIHPQYIVVIHRSAHKIMCQASVPGCQPLGAQRIDQGAARWRISSYVCNSQKLTLIGTSLYSERTAALSRDLVTRAVPQLVP